MGFTKFPKHVKKYIKILKDGSEKEYTYDNQIYNNNSKIKNIMELCRCGKMIRKYGKSIHNRTKKHIFLVKDMDPEPVPIRKNRNAFIICKCGSMIKLYSKKSHLKSASHIRITKGVIEPLIEEGSNIMQECECGIVIKKYSIPNHLKTKKHFSRIENLINKNDLRN